MLPFRAPPPLPGLLRGALSGDKTQLYNLAITYLKSTTVTSAGMGGGPVLWHFCTTRSASGAAARFNAKHDSVHRLSIITTAAKSHLIHSQRRSFPLMVSINSNPVCF